MSPKSQATFLLAWAVASLLGAAPARAEPPPPDWNFSWWPKLELENREETLALRLGGRLLLDGGFVRYDEGLVNRTSPPGWNTEGLIRQARIYLLARAWDFDLKAEVDFAPDDPSLTDVYLGWRGPRYIGTVRFGHQKQPFSLEEQTSRRYLVFMERSLASALDPSVRDLGLSVRNTAFDERLQWAIGGFRDTKSTGYEFGELPSWSVSTRVSGLPVWRNDGSHLLHLGLSYQHDFRERGSFSIARSPESSLADDLLDTGPILGVGGIDRIAGEFAWLRGPFEVQGEASYEYLHRDAGAGNLSFGGAYLLASWFATGEHRAYSKKAGVFSQVVPLRNFDPRGGGWGAFQLGARVSYADLDDRDVRGGRETNLTFAANWFLDTHLRLSFNYIHGWVIGQGDVDILQGRFQLLY